jgi:hypothetical protein
MQYTTSQSNSRASGMIHLIVKVHSWVQYSPLGFCRLAFPPNVERKNVGGVLARNAGFLKCSLGTGFET